MNDIASDMLAKYRADKRYPLSHVYHGHKAMKYAKIVFSTFTDGEPDYWNRWTDKQKREAVSFVVTIKRKKSIKYIFKLVIGDTPS